MNKCVERQKNAENVRVYEINIEKKRLEKTVQATLQNFKHVNSAANAKMKQPCLSGIEYCACARSPKKHTQTNTHVYIQSRKAPHHTTPIAQFRFNEC